MDNLKAQEPNATVKPTRCGVNMKLNYTMGAISVVLAGIAGIIAYFLWAR